MVFVFSQNLPQQRKLTSKLACSTLALACSDIGRAATRFQTPLCQKRQLPREKTRCCIFYLLFSRRISCFNLFCIPSVCLLSKQDSLRVNLLQKFETFSYIIDDQHAAVTNRIAMIQRKAKKVRNIKPWSLESHEQVMRLISQSETGEYGLVSHRFACVCEHRLTIRDQGQHSVYECVRQFFVHGPDRCARINKRGCTTTKATA